jgi:hypothetical protein
MTAVFRTYSQIRYRGLFLLIGFGDFFLIGYDLAAMLANAIDVRFYRLYERLFCLIRVIELDKLLFYSLTTRCFVHYTIRVKNVGARFSLLMTVS